MRNNKVSNPKAESGPASENQFSRPLLIYDDMCSSCARFAKTAARVSRGWIRIAGHYKSQEAINVKKAIFPSNYDATKMFWLVNKKGAFGARSGLMQTAKEILIGNFKWFEDKCGKRNNNDNNNEANSSLKDDDDDGGLQMQCYYKDKASCMSTTSTLKRLFNMLKNSDKFNF
ncbi:MAG: hypothetical protein ACTHKJ_10225 [Candidatus Nitrosocosmicus sp.]